jgi:Holliday junction resolvase RusA-like endonuclease
MCLFIVAVFPRPKSKTRKRGLNPREPKVSKPDVDNLAKSILDALSGLAYTDDSMIYSLSVSKWIASGDEVPHVEIEVSYEKAPEILPQRT